jgi:hypothetical protein
VQRRRGGKAKMASDNDTQVRLEGHKRTNDINATLDILIGNSVQNWILLSQEDLRRLEVEARNNHHTPVGSIELNYFETHLTGVYQAIIKVYEDNGMAIQDTIPYT